jgi:hypothetical protein
MTGTKYVIMRSVKVNARLYTLLNIYKQEAFLITYQLKSLCMRNRNHTFATWTYIRVALKGGSLPILNMDRSFLQNTSARCLGISFWSWLFLIRHGFVAEEERCVCLLWDRQTDTSPFHCCLHLRNFFILQTFFSFIAVYTHRHTHTYTSVFSPR